MRLRRLSEWWTPPVILAVAVTTACLATALLLGGPILGRVARARAASQGITLDIGSASLGFGVVRFDRVSVSFPRMPAVTATLDRVEIAPSFTLSVGRIDVRGGRARIGGSAEELERQLKAFRAARDGGPRGAASASGATVSIAGIDVTWVRPDAPRGAGYVWGARYERRADLREVLSADLVRMGAHGAHFELREARIDFAQDAGGRRITGVTARDVAGVFSADDARADGVATGEPSRSPNVPGPPETPLDWGPEARRRMARLSSTVANLLGPSTSLGLPRVRFQIRRGGETLNVGPATLALGREKDRVRFGLTTAAAENATPLRLGVTAPVGAGPVELEITGGPIALSALGVEERDMGLEDVGRAEVEVDGRARLSEDGRALSISGRSKIRDLSIMSPRLAAEPVRGLVLAVGGEADLRTDGSHVALKNVSLGVGKMRLETRGEVEQSDGHARGKVHFGVPLAACADLFTSIPSGLMPLLRGVEVSGTFSVTGEVGFDTRRPGDTRVDWTLANECRITRVPTELAPSRFRSPWVRAVFGADLVPTTIDSGPGTAGWVPLYDVSPHVATAVVVCEDARFFTHDGFDEKSIQSSIRDNLRAGKFVRGGSTVSMQLAKNLYLGREKTLSRKLQEAVLTALLEQELTKDQILELYLNVIEFAPGVYGIGPAAAHYFRASPKELSLAQALYLVSILPNPRVHHFDPAGVLGARWTEYLKKLMVVAHKIRRIDDTTLQGGLAETVRFGTPADTVPVEGAEGEEGSATPDILDLAPRDAAEGP